MSDVIIPWHQRGLWSSGADIMGSDEFMKYGYGICILHNVHDF